MKTGKARMSLVLVTLILSIALMPIANAEFEDLRPDHWGYKKITELENKGLIKGYSDGTFRPDSTITRAEFVVLASNYFGYGEKDEAMQAFTDVTDKVWPSGYINKAAEIGYVSGYPDGTFRPDEAITRQEAIVILSKILKIDNRECVADMSKFSDTKDIASWAYNSVKNYVAEGFISGYEDETIKPLKMITRAEAVQLLNVLKEEIVLEETKNEISTRPTKAEYIVEFYYEKLNQQTEKEYYSEVPDRQEFRSGKIGKNVQVGSDDLLPENGYVFDNSAANIMSGTVKRNTPLVMKVYFSIHREFTSDNITKWLLEQTRNTNSKAYEFFKRFNGNKALNSTGMNFASFVNSDLAEYFDFYQNDYTWKVERNSGKFIVYFVNISIENMSDGEVVRNVTRYSEGRYSFVDMYVEKDGEGNKVLEL